MTHVLSHIRRFFADDSAQDAFEYILVIGGITVAVILAVATPVGNTIINAVVRGTCLAMDTIPVISAQLTCPA